MYNIYDKYCIPWKKKKRCRKKFSFYITEFRRQRSLKMVFSSTLTLVLVNICYANTERKHAGFLNRSSTGKSQRKEISRQIPFTSFSTSVMLRLPRKFMKINTYSIRQNPQPSPYWQKHWCQHLFLRGLWDCGNRLLLDHCNQDPPSSFCDAKIRRNIWLCSYSPKIHGQSWTVYCSLH